MKLALVGVGSAGVRIVDRIIEREVQTGRNFCNGNMLVFDTTQEVFEGVEHVPEDHRALFGDVSPRIDENGTGGNPDLGVEIAREDVHEISRAFDTLDFTEVDGTLVIGGLGGGTGGGSGAVLLEELQTISEKPVYALGVLPEADESDRAALNAARALPSFVEIADNVVLFDNEEWGSQIDKAGTELEYDEDGETDGESKRAYDELNRTIASHVLLLLGAGEIESMTIAENRADASDLARTLKTGGVSSIGQATQEIDRSSGLLSRLVAFVPFVGDDEGPEPTDAVKVKRLVKDAVGGRLSLPCAVDSTERTLVVLSGPPSAVSRKGFESARHWLENATDTVEVMAGDEPRPKASSMTATVLLSNVTAVSRIDEMQQRAVSVTDEFDDEDEVDPAESEFEFV
ncbi:tubulin/FtsZ family protein [Natronobacterium gregoryi]|uniref:Tubulin-like protein CetZ n=2 Tax=Natronobacterium gregoryi TaxID=44930 RepID=L0AK11_NATGS|nr:tubulin/FtsZ family protein [Natronobacterium gregoryi]AFZ73522.1 cell division GTPase [Natronobacterium gregoryi SP2]ELY68378.1 Tubulin/FtsZ GTPase [Natronobacterium gregoryi SP2]PLK20575.1 cell division protein FtsZ [Natronobacterium gregoryi SP2]SFJ16824.1 Cell division GTPase FtsZ [Natronobacterium gregoryi]